MSEIRYEKILQRQGLRSELPTLDSGEFGFAKDTGQLFIGSNPDDSIYIKNNIIAIDAFPNAVAVVQGYLNQSTDYQAYGVRENLTIETESHDKAIEIIDYVNNTNEQQSGSSVGAIARLEQNIEVVTNENINDYILPSDFNVNYNPVVSFARPSRSLQSKTLDSASGGVFLRFDIKQIFHLTVHYTVVQDDGWHRRSGVMALTSDNATNPEGYIGFDDDQNLVNAAISTDFIQFDASVDSANSQVVVTFSQPIDHSTKIFYRIERWNIDGVVEGPFNELPEPPPNDVLGVEDGALGITGGSILGIDRD